VQFQYVFSSEEYSDFSNTSFNDVFVFFVNGVNIAVVPGTKLAIADASDHILDSAVFLRAQSFISGSPTPMPSPSPTKKKC
jgi:hypothetical protein